MPLTAARPATQEEGGGEWVLIMPIGRWVPGLVHRGQEWSKPAKSAKVLPLAIERRVLPDVRVTAYRLAA